jgi:hypothetical protein
MPFDTHVFKPFLVQKFNQSPLPPANAILNPSKITGSVFGQRDSGRRTLCRAQEVPAHWRLVMSRISKSILLAAAGATALAAMPAQARDNWGGGRHHDGIDAGDVIAGALIIGGIAAIASAASNGSRYGGGRYGWRDRDYGGYNNGYNNDYGYYQNGYGSRAAVDQCVRRPA